MINLDTILQILPGLISIFISLFFIMGMLLLVYVLSKKSRLDFSFTVGEKEKHEVRFVSDRMWGLITVYVDGVKKLRKFKFLNGNANYTLSVGESEKHTLLFQLTIPFFYGAYRTSTCEVLCDNKMIKTVSSGEQGK